MSPNTASNIQDDPNDASSLPYNELNHLIDASSVEAIFKEYGVSFKVNNINHYRTAMVHRSYCTRKNENFVNGNTMCPPNCLPLQEESNERLEFLGDAVINLMVGKYLFDRYPDENEGFLTKLRTKLVNGNMLATLCEIVQLQRYVIISKQIEANNGRLNKKILEDIFEAFIGAMYCDLGETNGSALEKVEEWFINMLETNIDFSELITTNTNYKDMFLKYYQHTHNYIPKFFEISSESLNNGKIYTVCVKDKNRCIISTGKGPSKKHAENDAAHNALKYFGQLQD